MSTCQAAVHLRPPSPGAAACLLRMVCARAQHVVWLLWCRGPLGWLVPSEVQPLETRAAGTGINTMVNFLLTFVIGQVIVSVLDALDRRQT